MQRLLLTVEDRFIIKGRGIGVVPTIPCEQATGTHEQTSVTLRLPDGNAVLAIIFWTRWTQNPPQPTELWGHVMCTMLDAEDAPSGPEIWLHEET